MMRTRTRHVMRTALALPLVSLLACTGNGAGDTPSGGQRPPAQQPPGVPAPGVQPPGVKVNGSPEAAQATYSALRASAAAAAKLDAAGARAAYPVQFAETLGYDPNAAQFMDRIQRSALALSDGERGVLGDKGFVISQRREFATFARGYAEIYAEHLPVYISADALLETVHRSYDTILTRFELQLLIPELRSLLTGMRSRLNGAKADARVIADTDLYLCVALSLLDDKLTTSNGNAAQVKTLFDKAKQASGTSRVTLFGVERDEDFSQFEPRGHYEGEPLLEAYFRAMIWLGRVDLRMLETQSDGTQLFRRSQYLASLLMHELVGPDLSRFETIDNVVRTFVGESDYMVLGEVNALVADLGGLAAARDASDQAIASAIIAGGYGQQEIASHLMVNDGTVETLPLNRSFTLFGQRYIVDSHVFSQVVYDRLPGKRMMPSPLDAAFAALGNNHALTLNGDVDKYSALPGALARMRTLVDAHDSDFWGKNFYNLWLAALRSLSPAADLSGDAVEGLPAVARSEAWSRRMLNAQLGSWAELRHDTLLYAKQSYTGIPGCAFPDAYVDPYPAFYANLRKYAEAGSRIAALAADQQDFAAQITAYFAALADAAGNLEDMAARELRGEPFSAAQLAFINDAVRIEKQDAICTTIDVPDGWYADLFFERDESIEFDPTIADVHTQPADELGNTVGKVLHVGTGYPRLLVSTVDTCEGPRAYAGVVYAYHEQITDNFERLTDSVWTQRFQTNGVRPNDVPWLAPVLAR